MNSMAARRLEAQLLDPLDDVLDVLLGIHEQDRLIDSLLRDCPTRGSKVHRRLIGQEHVGIDPQWDPRVPSAPPRSAGRITPATVNSSVKISGSVADLLQGLPQDLGLPASVRPSLSRLPGSVPSPCRARRVLHGSSFLATRA